METRAILLMAAVAVVVIGAFRRGYQNGMAVSIALLIALPTSLRLDFGGPIPEFTVQRLILCVVLLSAMFGTGATPLRARVPLLGSLLLLLAAQFVSFVVSVDHSASFKSFLAFALEVVLFYVVLSRSLFDREQIETLLRVLVCALAVVAVIAWIERRWDFNLSQRIVTGESTASIDVTATYPHRIILGYAMAMGVPMLLALIEREGRRKERRRLWVMLGLVAAGCYFSNSRGPWLGLIAGCGVMGLFGPPRMRRKLILLGILAMAVALSRPGVRDTLVSAYRNTFYADSVKGKSYEYRWRLWHVAAAEISKSPERMLFGHGGLSTETMDLSHYFDKESGGTTTALGYTSWDNQFACNLIEFGLVGFILEVGLLVAAMRILLSRWRRARAPDRSMILGFAASCAIYIFALTNVYIFSPQLKFLFWTLLACGIRWSFEAERQRNPATAAAVRREVPVHAGGGFSLASGNN